MRSRVAEFPRCEIAFHSEYRRPLHGVGDQSPEYQPKFWQTRCTDDFAAAGQYSGVESASIPRVDRYEKWYDNYEAHVGHYFRTLYNLVRYVDEHGGKQRASYARLVRAQLSSHELQLLLFNGLSKYGREKFKPLIEEYTLLKHLKETAENKDAREQYASTAFVKDSNKEVE
ncbi:MAG: putative phage abortive infection protein [Planctomycetaceae bacterium]